MKKVNSWIIITVLLIVCSIIPLIGTSRYFLYCRRYSEDTDTLGNIVGNTLNMYLDTYPSFENKTSSKQVQIPTLFGNPS